MSGFLLACLVDRGLWCAVFMLFLPLGLHVMEGEQQRLLIVRDNTKAWQKLSRIAVVERGYGLFLYWSMALFIFRAC